MRYIAPSILSADFARLGEQVEMLNSSDAEWIHVDVMDGVFVPNISFGFPIMQVLEKIARKPLDVHLMITHPERYVERFADAGAFSVGFHLEAVDDPLPILDLIRKKGVKTKEGLSNMSTTNCPNCGAPTQITSAGQCEYCGSVITTGEHDWVLTDIHSI